MYLQYLVLRGYLNIYGDTLRLLYFRKTFFAKYLCSRIAHWGNVAESPDSTPLKFPQSRVCFYFCFDASDFMHMFSFLYSFLNIYTIYTLLINVLNTFFEPSPNELAVYKF